MFDRIYDSTMFEMQQTLCLLAIASQSLKNKISKFNMFNNFNHLEILPAGTLEGTLSLLNDS